MRIVAKTANNALSHCSIHLASHRCTTYSCSQRRLSPTPSEHFFSGSGRASRVFTCSVLVSLQVSSSSSSSAVISLLTNSMTSHGKDLITTDDLYRNIPLALTLSSLAGASTGLGGLLTVLQSDVSKSRLGHWQGAAAGFMLSVCAFDLLPSLLHDIDAFPAAVFSAVGAILFVLLRVHIPEPDLETMGVKTSEKEVLWSGLLTAAGISLHNFPEGIAVCIASLKGLKFGLPLALAIGLHNIPEGMAVALPLYYATRNKTYAVKMAFLSGMAEPAGVIFVLLFITLIGALTRAFVAFGMAAVVGVMTVLSVWELMPQAVRYAGWGGVASSVVGFVIMAAMLKALESLGLGV